MSVGRDYEVSVAVPATYARSDSKYPVLYVLDANGNFAIAVETERLLAISRDVQDEPIIVGIGYPVGLASNTASLRVTDLTPTADPNDDREYAKEIAPLAPPVSGGGPAFARCLREEILPFVESRYRIDQARRSLHGHSLGGLFALYVLFQQPGMFQNFLVSSPAIWWDHDVLWRLERDYASGHREVVAHLFLTSGTLEERESDKEEAAFRLVSNVRKLDDLLRARAYEGLWWQTDILEAETHNSMVSVGLERGLRRLYGQKPGGS